MAKTWRVSYMKKQWFYYDVEGEDYDEAKQNALEEIHNQEPQEDDSEYNIEEEEEMYGT